MTEGINFNLIEYEGSMLITNFWMNHNSFDRMNLFQSVFNQIFYDNMFYSFKSVYIYNSEFQDPLTGVLINLAPPEA